VKPFGTVALIISDMSGAAVDSKMLPIYLHAINVRAQFFGTHLFKTYLHEIFRTVMYIFPYLGFPNGKNTIGFKLPRN